MVCKICPAGGSRCASLVDPASAATSDEISPVADQEDENGCAVVVAGLAGTRFVATCGREDLSPVRPSVGLAVSLGRLGIGSLSVILTARPESEALLTKGSWSAQSLNVASAVTEHWSEFSGQLPARWDPFLGIRVLRLRRYCLGTPAAPWRHSVNAADFNGYRDQPPYVTTEPPRNASSVPRYDQHPRSFRPRRFGGAYEFQGEELRYSEPMSSAEYFNPHPEVRPLPVCYACGIPGHIARYCGRRRAAGYGQSAPSTQSSRRIRDVQWPRHSMSEGHF
ncbi:hypothetical protein HPB50_023966 [Hyalomma asiaticum]|uniref:Uncharacterized protein n=1 Tax=Hyalomma asiaticum TaxID=266040 RepID=A0ACB7S7M7_HYAAI|nr:hypothetical protein HPB50_023966 [Hyalomma asiaticum]